MAIETELENRGFAVTLGGYYPIDASIDMNDHCQIRVWQDGDKVMVSVDCGVSQDDVGHVACASSIEPLLPFIDALIAAGKLTPTRSGRDKSPSASEL